MTYEEAFLEKGKDLAIQLMLDKVVPEVYQEVKRSRAEGAPKTRTEVYQEMKAAGRVARMVEEYSEWIIGERDSDHLSSF